MFDFFKKSRRQVNRENRERGREAERRVKQNYELAGFKVERTGLGHDFKVSKTNLLTGKTETRYVEVKTGRAKLSELQKKKRRQFGDRYVEERVGTGPFGIGTQSIRGAPKKSSGKSRRAKKQTKKPSGSNPFDF